MPRLPSCLALAVALVLAGCGGGQAAETPAPTRPAVPLGWIDVAEDRGEVHLFLPPDIKPFFTDGTIFANTEPGPTGTIWWEVRATGPRSLVPQPSPGQSVADWLDGVLEGAPARGPTTTETVALPAGPALRLRTTIDTDTPNPIVVIGYAIQTTAGIGVLQILGPASQFDERAAEFELIAMLVEFSPAHDP